MKRSPRARRYDAVLLDFYGTLVEEDTPIIARTTVRIAAASRPGTDAREVGRFWSERFSASCSAANGEAFHTQRDIEQATLRETLEHFGAALDPIEISNELFSYWSAPKPVPGADAFLAALSIPFCVASNIDTRDLDAAVAGLGWHLPDRVTSESARAYKPNGALFEAALSRVDVAPSRALHVGDSLRSDVAGAAALGIDTAWINTSGRTLDPHAVPPTHIVASVRDLLTLGMLSAG